MTPKRTLQPDMKAQESSAERVARKVHVFVERTREEPALLESLHRALKAVRPKPEN